MMMVSVLSQHSHSPTHSSAARIHGCIHSLLGHHAVKTTLGCTSLLRLSHIYAVIVKNCNNILFQPCLWISYCMAINVPRGAFSLVSRKAAGVDRQ